MKFLNPQRDHTGNDLISSKSSGTPAASKSPHVTFILHFLKVFNCVLKVSNLKILQFMEHEISA